MDQTTLKFHTTLLRAAKMIVAAWEQWLQEKAALRG